MKKLLVSSMTLACVLAATTASADFPEIVIDDQVVLNYGEGLDLTDAIWVPTTELDKDFAADLSINQFNHDSPVSADGGVVNNLPTGEGLETITNIEVNVTAIGNNGSVDLVTNNLAIGAVQGNQEGGASAVGAIDTNRIDLDMVTDADGVETPGIVELNVTAVGNNLTVGLPTDEDGEVVPDLHIDHTILGTVQFNYDSPVTATGSISGNGFRVEPASVERDRLAAIAAAEQAERDRLAAIAAAAARPRFDPKLVVSAIGNNLTSIAGTTGSLTQINRGSAITATGIITDNLGEIGPVYLDVTAVGNNISLSD